MRVTTLGPNLRDQSTGTFHVHAANCADLRKSIYRGAEQDTQDYASLTAIILDVYPPDQFEYDPETELGVYASDFHFFPCVSELPMLPASWDVSED